jgi:hypothetical protein
LHAVRIVDLTKSRALGHGRNGCQGASALSSPGAAATFSSGPGAVLRGQRPLLLLRYGVIGGQRACKAPWRLCRTCARAAPRHRVTTGMNWAEEGPRLRAQHFQSQSPLRNTYCADLVPPWRGWLSVRTSALFRTRRASTPCVLIGLRGRSPPR